MKCQLPGCNHYTPMKSKLSAPILVGVLTLCNKCVNPFELTRRALRQEKPICDNCVGSVENKSVMVAEDFFQQLEKDLKK